MVCRDETGVADTAGAFVRRARQVLDHDRPTDSIWATRNPAVEVVVSIGKVPPPGAPTAVQATAQVIVAFTT